MKLTITEIVKLVSEATGVDEGKIIAHTNINERFAKYAAICIMHEEGIKNAHIARYFGCIRSNIGKSLQSINNLLITNKAFKKLYLTCIAKYAELERQNPDELQLHGERVMQSVCEVYNTVSEMLSGRSRDKTICDARYMFILLLCKTRPHVTDAELSSFLKRDRTTMIYGRAEADFRFNNSREFRKLYRQAMAMLLLPERACA